MTICIKGAPRTFNQLELEQRQAGFHNVYRSTDQCCTMVHSDVPFGFLAKVIEMNDQGYTLSIKYPIGCAPLSYYCSMVKPDRVQAKDIETINERVKAEYVAELQAEHVQYKQLLEAQLLERAELKEQQRADDKKAKQLEAIRKEVADVYGEKLIIP
ncbi:hypothetical protein PS664_03880 [Pseudomonas fluorescens]|nr:hypothetical protein PS664_03880 [Pseudomonas fluorescens]